MLHRPQDVGEAEEIATLLEKQKTTSPSLLHTTTKAEKNRPNNPYCRRCQIAHAWGQHVDQHQQQAFFPSQTTHVTTPQPPRNTAGVPHGPSPPHQTPNPHAGQFIPNQQPVQPRPQQQQSYNVSTRTCFSCGELGHYARNCPRNVRSTIPQVPLK